MPEKSTTGIYDTLIEQLRPIAAIINERDAQVAAANETASVRLASFLSLLGTAGSANGAPVVIALSAPPAATAEPAGTATPLLESLPVAAAPEPEAVEPEPDATPTPETLAESPETIAETPAPSPVADAPKPKRGTAQKNACVDCGAPTSRERCRGCGVRHSNKTRAVAKPAEVQKPVGPPVTAPAPPVTAEEAVTSTQAAPSVRPSASVPTPPKGDLDALRVEVASAKHIYADQMGFDLFRDEVGGKTVYFTVPRNQPVDQIGKITPLTRFLRKGNGTWEEMELTWHKRRMSPRA